MAIATLACFAACSSSSSTTVDDAPHEATTVVPPVVDVEDAMRAALAPSFDAMVDATPPPPAYDLEADMSAREDLAREIFGDKVRLDRVEDVFLVVGGKGMSARAYTRALKVIDKTIVAFLNNRFDVLPEQAVGIYLFATKKPYEKYCDEYYNGCGTPYGVYYYYDRRIVMNIGPGIGTLTHELVHPVIDADFPSAPEWINEGIASLYERPSYPKAGEITGKTNWRLPRLKKAMRSKTDKDLATLHRLVGMSDEVFRGDDEDLHYSMGRYFAQWMDEQDLLWPFYRTWRDDFANDPTGAATFEAIVGKTPEEATPDWVKWAKGL
jgi:hypothetical protein